MKGSDRSLKHSKKSNGSYLSDKNKHRSVLKETHHYKEESIEGRNKQQSSKTKKEHHSVRKEKSSDHKSRHSHRKSSETSSKHRKEDDRSRNKKQHDEESYEELSRKKRKIESELHALDLEEAAQREAETKRTQRREDTDSKQAKVRVKEEPKSDDERPASRKEKARNRAAVKREPGSDAAAAASSSEGGRWGEPPGKPAKEQPDFSTSGKLAEDTNTYNGVVIKYNEPAEARKPKRRWRLYPFKGDADLPFIPIHRQSAYLFGRTRKIADIPIDHPSCSKQHAVLQFRLVGFRREDGSASRRVRPYIIDLGSSNGTFVNNRRIEARRYVELVERDVVKFGYSTREYVVLHEESKNEEVDEDEVLESAEDKAED